MNSTIRTPTPPDTVRRLSQEAVQRRLDRFEAPARDPDYGTDDYVDPSRYWGERLGIPGLFSTYDEVFGGCHPEAQKAIRAACLGSTPRDSRRFPVLNGFHESLCAFYPEIAELEAKSTWERWVVVNGCVSKFTAADIGYFIEVFGLARDPEESRRRMAIQEVLGHHLEWRVGPRSLSLLEESLGLPSPGEWVSASGTSDFAPSAGPRVS